MKRTSPALQKKRVRLRGAEGDIRATSRAFYRLAEPSEHDLLLAETELAFVDDPVEDWAENASDADDWLKDHGVRSDEECDL